MLVVANMKAINNAVMLDADNKPFYVTVRHKRAIEKAITQIIDSAVPVDKILLYGSCSRGAARYDSDVDVCVIIQRALTEEEQGEYIRLKGRLMWSDLPEIDLHIINGERLDEDSSTYINAIRRDGIVLWRAE